MSDHRSGRTRRGLERAALSYAANGFEVFPLKPRDKRPLHSGWFADATGDVAAIAERWRQCPAANVGVSCRGLVVLDADSDEGLSAIRKLGTRPSDTTVVRTRRGKHFVFEGRARSRASILPGLDVRAGRAFVVGAGSIHPSGARYEWETPPWEAPPAPVPDAVRELLRKPAPRYEPDGPILSGSRNVTLTKLAGGLRGLGLSPEEIRGVLHEHNSRRCAPPLPGNEIEQIVKSAARWDGPPPWLRDLLGFVDDPALDARERHVLAALCSHARADGRCWPSIRRLAALTKLKPDTVTSAIKRLEAHDRLVVSRSRRSGNLYRVLDRPNRGSSVPPIGTPERS